MRLPACIYCGSSDEPRLKREHVIPQSYGAFHDNWTLDCVCDGCNEYFGQKLELILGRDSSESILRMTYGLKPAKEAKDLLNRRMILTVEEDGPWKGARAFIAATATGNGIELLPFPQAAFKRKLEIAFTWIPEEDLNATSVAPFLPAGTEVQVVGPSDEDLKRVSALLQSLGFPSLEHRTHGFIGGDKKEVTFAGEATVDAIVQRAIAKIAFNYFAYVHGGDFVRRACFDSTRRFIRYGEAAGYQVTTPTSASILTDHARVGPQTNGHLLVVQWSDPGQLWLQAKVSLFNQMTYVVRFCEYYSGLWVDIAAGHLFDPFDHQITKLTNARLIKPPW